MKVMKSSGAGGQDRTDDILITNQVLYQLSYAGSSNSLSGGQDAFDGQRRILLTDRSEPEQTLLP
jgi:hypothetical protein